MIIRTQTRVFILYTTSGCNFIRPYGGENPENKTKGFIVMRCIHVCSFYCISTLLPPPPPPFRRDKFQQRVKKMQIKKTQKRNDFTETTQRTGLRIAYNMSHVYLIS